MSILDRVANLHPHIVGLRSISAPVGGAMPETCAS